MKIITFLFGKPCEKDGSFKSKYFRFFYWFMVVFLLSFLVVAVIMCFFEALMIPATLVALVVVPLVSRSVYSINLKIQGLKREGKNVRKG